MALRQIWRQTAALGLESAYGTSPTTTQNWYEAGKYFMMPITSFGFDDTVAKSLSETLAGRREQYNYAPVPGNKMSAGTIQGDVMAASLGVLLKMALGTVSTSATADAANPLGTSADLSGGTIAVSDPTTSAFLEFVITSAAGAGMSLTVAGTDANGDTVTETITVVLDSGDATVQTRYSYTSLSAAVTATGFSSGACTVNGYVKSVHTITLADTPVSYTAINKGAPGRGASQDGFHAGVLMRSLRLDFDAGNENAPFTYSADFISKYPTYDTEVTLPAIVGVPFSAWNAAVTIDGGAYYKVVRGSIEIAANNNAIWTADGAQDSRYSIGGPFGVTGSLLLLPEDDTEWGYYEDNTEMNWHITWTNTLDALDATTDKSLLLEMTRLYLTDASATDFEGAQAIEANFGTIYDSSDGALKATLTNHVHSYA